MELSRREKWLLTVPVFLGGAILFYNYVHEPLFARKHTAEAQYEKVKVDLAYGQTRLKQQGDLNARQSAVSNREKVVDAWVPGKNSAAMLIWYLSQAELNSGARVKEIKLSDRKNINPSDPQSLKAAPAAASQPASGPAPADQPAPAPAPAQQPNPGAKPAPSPDAVDPDANITVIGIDLKVDARFVEHMLFSQAIEQLPLFLRVDSLDMSLSNKPLTDQASELLKKGDRASAERLLSASPIVTATYHIDLYFKGPRPGPAVSSTMQFADGTGKLDPFALDSVNDFVQALQDYIQQQGESTTQPGSGQTQPGNQPDQPKQLG